jgi:hypothetical protein
MVSTGRVLVAIVQICRAAERWELLNEHVVVLARRRSQLKQAVAKMVQQCVEYVDQTPDKATMVKLIDTLRSVTEGKVCFLYYFNLAITCTCSNSFILSIILLYRRSRNNNNNKKKKKNVDSWWFGRVLCSSSAEVNYIS